MRRIRGVKRKRTNSLTIKYLFVVFLFRQSIVHLLTLKKQKENEENEATPKSDDDVGGGSIVGSMLA